MINNELKNKIFALTESVATTIPQNSKDLNKSDEDYWNHFENITKALTDLSNIFISVCERNQDNKKIFFLSSVITISLSNMTTFIHNSNINQWVIQSAIYLSIRKQIELNIILTPLLLVTEKFLDARLSHILNGKYTFNYDEMDVNDDQKQYFVKPTDISNKTFINTNDQIRFCCALWEKFLEVPVNQKGELAIKTIKLYDETSDMVHNKGFFKNTNIYKEKSSNITIDGQKNWDLGRMIGSVPWNAKTAQKIYQNEEDNNKIGEMLITLLIQDKQYMSRIQVMTMFLIGSFIKKITK